MRPVGALLGAAVVAVVAACAPTRLAEPRCPLRGATQSFLEGAFADWEVVRERQLRLPPAPPPRLIVFDRYCVYSFEAGGTGTMRLRAGADTLRGTSRPHAGAITLPNGRSIPVGGTAFASLVTGDSLTFLVLALEDVWRRDPAYRAAAEDWPSYLRRSFIHEMTHARQLAVWVPMLRIAGGRAGLADFDDDIVQQRFDTVAGFRADVLAETTLLYDAAAATSTARRLALARQAVDQISDRRVRVYGGTDAPWARIEQILLDMEGAAQWAAMAHVSNTARLGVLGRRNVVRGSRQYWSQEQGLALYLVLDALVPDWTARMFSANPPSSLELLQAALAR